jgi:hypothetical protein
MCRLAATSYALRQERNAPEQRLLRWAIDVDPLAI